MTQILETAGGPAGPAAAAPPAAPADLLSGIDGPADLRRLARGELAALARQIRAFLVEKVCATGGHLGVNLGVVELTIALHRVFDSPRDAVLFDTGHQSYVHKALTGRQGGFDRLRQLGGLSGYPSRAESEHDWIENSHASTVLAYADGLSKAFALRGECGRHVVAVIGDGAMTGGLAWEALNNIAAAPGRALIIVLNDNGRSYDPTAGGLAASGNYEAFVESVGLPFVGPVDGHDVAAVEAALRKARRLGSTVVVHCKTAKGRGYAPAEADEADRMHGIGLLDPATGRPSAAAAASWTSLFGQAVTRLGERRPELVCISAAMVQPVGLRAFARRFPHRVFDVGIAEQQAVCSAAGLAMAGLHPVVCLYATFLNRAFDQVLMDVALHKLPVTFVLDRAGVTGPDGPSHHGMWDLAVLGAVPGLRIAAPRDPARLCELLEEAVSWPGPTALRFPKAGACDDIQALGRIDALDILRRTAHGPLDVLLVSAGVMAQPCLDAARLLERDGLGVTVVDPRWLTPVSDSLVNLAARHRLAVTVEDGLACGGFGTRFSQACSEAGVSTPVLPLGLPTAFLPHAERSQLLAHHGLDAAGIHAAAARRLAPCARAAAPRRVP
jgi:1-deoxy-D-xylulose-5-phosphate synthase